MGAENNPNLEKGIKVNAFMEAEDDTGECAKQNIQINNKNVMFSKLNRWMILINFHLIIPYSIY